MDKVVTLPDGQEIMERLKKVYMGDGDYMAENFFPMIAKEGGHELVAAGVVIMLTLKIYDFIKDGGYSPMMKGILHMYVPQLIDALIDDKEVATEAKTFHKEALNK